MSNLIKVSSASPKVVLGNPNKNADNIISLIEEACNCGSKLIAFPELAITGYSIGDLLMQDALIEEAWEAAERVIDSTSGKDIVVIFGLPLLLDGALYDAALSVKDGAVIGRSFKDSYEDNYGLKQTRYFSLGKSDEMICPFDDYPSLTMEVKIGNDYISNGADILVNITEGSEVVFGNCNKMFTYKDFSSGRAMIISSCGFGESTTDHVYSGYKGIMQNNDVIKAACARHTTIIYGDIDIDNISGDKEKYFSIVHEDNNIYKDPFLKDSLESHNLNKVIDLQARSLVSRLEAINCKKIVIGISGGLDSTYALLISNIAFELLGYKKEDIVAISMPCFGTSDKTRKFAESLIKSLGNTYREINISESVKKHFDDIDHNFDSQNIAFENAQARERTQVLMDIANDIDGIVVGTGDMSELALGFCTYGGDQMSMYGINSGVPKSVIRKVVRFIGDNIYVELKDLLKSILEIPVSPELLPSGDEAFVQKTEDILGPYELHDFILYYMLKCGMSPKNIYDNAKNIFDSEYSSEVIKNTLRTFYKRFFASQFKRSCMPDGAKIFDVSLSPRDGLFMPSDASVSAFLEEIDNLK